MKAFTIRVTPAQGAPYSYSGLFKCSVDAILHAMEHAPGGALRISAKAHDLVEVAP